MSTLTVTVTVRFVFHHEFWEIFKPGRNAYFLSFYLQELLYCKVPVLSFLADPPECEIDPHCRLDQACIQQKCRDPCTQLTCGTNAECKVYDHRAVCVCRRGFDGHPYTHCEERREQLFKNKFQSTFLPSNSIILFIVTILNSRVQE